MAFSTGGSGGGAAPMADMNVTPLVDVMLVLLIIFMVTAPVMSYQIQIDLPQPVKDFKPPEHPPEPIRLKIDAAGQLFWNDMPMPKSALRPSLMVEALRENQPTLEIDTNPEVQYEVLTSVLAEAKNAGMKKIGFVEGDQQ